MAPFHRNRWINLQVSGASEVAAVSEIGSSHHVLWIVHLLGQLVDGNGTERVGASGGERSESDHEEMETWEWNHVDSELAKIGVELTWETQAGGDTGHDSGNEMVQVAVRWGAELQGTHANIVQSLVIDTESLVGVLNCQTVSKSRVNTVQPPYQVDERRG